MADEPLDALSEDAPDDSYDPSSMEATRAREQGLGMGAKDLARQRDAHRLPDAADEDDEDTSALGAPTIV